MAHSIPPAALSLRDIAAWQFPQLARDLPQVRLWVGNSLRGLIPAGFILV